MKKLFIYLLITMTGLAAQNAWAQSSDVKVTKPTTNSGFVTVIKDGQTYTGTELDATTRNNYLTNICSANNTTTSCTISNTKPTVGTNESGVYLVEVNDYWIGMQGTWSVYDQLNKGVSKISAVNIDAKQETSSGTFYTHPARNVNKFFFIKLRSKLRRDDTPFGWYDEWSYVTDTDVNGSKGWDALEPTWDTLMDGTPFPSPHNCNSSLENNHYIALDGEIPTDRVGHDFTAYLYIPEKCKDGTEPSVTYETVGYGNISSTPTTYYIYNDKGYTRSSTSELTYVFTDASGSVSFAEAYKGKYYTTYWAGYGGSQVNGYPYENTKKVVKEGECPYVFFYAVGLNNVTDEALANNKKDNYDSTQNPYNVPLQWTTAFDKFKDNGVQKHAKYDGGSDASKGMQEHYLIERSYDNTNWEKVSDQIIVRGDDVINASNKTTVDTGLKPFDKVTEEIGYTVWYRVTSYVEKYNADGEGTRMSTTTSNVIRVDIPGKVPFKLTLEGEGTMTYDPVAQTNTFTNTIISAESKVTEKITLVNGSILGLYQVDTKGNQIKLLKDAKVSEVGQNNDLQELAKLIDNVSTGGELKGKYNHSMTLPAGDENVAAYQLMMTMPTTGGNVYKYSNILTITNPAISNATVKKHRSGTPDAATCTAKETFHNEIKFLASTKQVGTGYYIYRDASEADKEPKIKLNYTESGFRVDGRETYYKPDADGYISVVDIVEDAPIAVGENGRTNVDGGAWAYAVAYYDAKNNTYGSAAKDNNYEGSKDELVLSVTPEIKAANFSQPGNYNIYSVVTINWSRTLDMADTKPKSYTIYMKKHGKDLATATDQQAAAPLDMEAGFVKIATVEAGAATSYTWTETYLSKWQSENKKKYTKDELAKSLEGEYEVYVKMITTEDKEKNSFVGIPIPNAGTGIYTGIEGIEAQDIDVKVVNGVVEVNGVTGMIKVINAAGAVVAEAQGNGEVTEFEGLENGVYVVMAQNMNPTKILIK